MQYKKGKTDEFTTITCDANVKITPKLIPFEGKEVVLLHFIRREENGVLISVDIWPERYASWDDIIKLPSSIDSVCCHWCSWLVGEDYGECKVRQTVKWVSFYSGGKEISFSGENIDYKEDALLGDYLYNIYHKDFPIKGTIHDRIIVVDTETTGLPKDIDAPIWDFDNWPRLVELAWEEYDLQGNMCDSQSLIIRPDDFEIPLSSSKIHGISHDMALNVGYGLRESLLIFNSSLHRAKLIVGHNVSFDLKVIKSEMLRCGVGDMITGKSVYDTMFGYHQFCNFPGEKYSTLQQLYVKLFGKEFNNAHRAGNDVKATAECYWEMKRLGII